MMTFRLPHFAAAAWTLCAAFLAGCPADPNPPGATGTLTLLFSADAGGSVAGKATVIPASNIQALYVTIEQVLAFPADGGAAVQATTAPAEVNLKDLIGISELLDTAALPVGDYSGLQVALSNPELHLTSNPGTAITNVSMLDGGLFNVPADFSVTANDARRLLVDLGGIHLVQLNNGSYQLTPNFTAQAAPAAVSAQAFGEVKAVNRAAQSVAIEVRDALLTVLYGNAQIFLPGDSTTPSGTGDHLAVDQKILAVGELTAAGALNAATIVIARLDDNSEGNDDDEGEDDHGGDDDGDDDHGGGSGSGNNDANLLTIRLVPTAIEPLASGKARYEVRPGRSKLNIEVEDIRTATQVRFVLDGTVIGTQNVVLGTAELEFNSQDGDTVPVLRGDSRVEARNAANNALLMAGGGAKAGTAGLLARRGGEDDEGEDEGDDNGDDGPGHEGEDEGDDNGDDGPGHEGEDEGDDNGDDGPGHEGEDEGDDNGDDGPGHEGEDEGDDNGDDGPGHEGEDEGDDNGDDEGEDHGNGEGENNAAPLILTLRGTGAQPQAKGRAKYEVEEDETKLEIEVEHLRNVLTVQFAVNGTVLGARNVFFGEAEIEFESERDDVPAITLETLVEVIDFYTGEVVATTGGTAGEGEGEGQAEGEGQVEGEGEGTAEPGTDLTMARRVGSNNTFLPGTVETVTVTLNYGGVEPLTALGFTEELPLGWSLAEVVNGGGTVLAPQPGKTGKLDFAWITPPVFPVQVVYTVNIPADASGIALISGRALYRIGLGTEQVAEAITTVVGPGAPAEFAHSADSNANWNIGLGELMRVIQFYNLGEIHCENGTEDGYAPGAGEQTCYLHSSDYRAQDWRIDLSELLRLVQYFNVDAGAYHLDEQGEDGYTPGVYPQVY